MAQLRFLLSFQLSSGVAIEESAMQVCGLDSPGKRLKVIGLNTYSPGEPLLLCELQTTLISTEQHQALDKSSKFNSNGNSQHPSFYYHNRFCD